VKEKVLMLTTVFRCFVETDNRQAPDGTCKNKEDIYEDKSSRISDAGFCRCRPGTSAPVFSEGTPAQVVLPTDRTGCRSGADPAGV